jgi:hypothetical protein
MSTQPPADGRPPERADEAQPESGSTPGGNAHYLSTHGTPLVDTAKRQQPASAQQASQGGVDAAFLVKGFHIPPGKAASLVAGTDAAATEGEARRLLSEDDPLETVPTPHEPANDLAADTDEERLKPVLHRRRNI